MGKYITAERAFYMLLGLVHIGQWIMIHEILMAVVGLIYFALAYSHKPPPR